MNYLHHFHAGNFADCFKHAVLLELLRALTEKESPLCYLETHAGRGRYALDLIEHEQPEYLQGIAKLYGEVGLSPELHRYVERVKSVNHGELLNYPGSPLFAAMRLRGGDKLKLAELVPEQAKALAQLFEGDARVQVETRDGYQALKAWLPPTPKRALILIDPPFERGDEFKALQTALTDALKRFATGVYAIWYPIKVGRELAPWYRALAALECKNVLVAELCVHQDNSPLRLNGCGMAIINAPFQFDTSVARLLQAMHPRLRVHPQARADQRWLKSNT